jgi:ABC-type uncharacterized transport system fused permease/ATPase subunit
MCVAFFIITSILVRVQMDPITKLTFTQNRYEGDFRFVHTRLRTFAEVYSPIYHTLFVFDCS